MLVALLGIATASTMFMPNDPSDADIACVKKHFPDAPVDGRIAATTNHRPASAHNTAILHAVPATATWPGSRSTTLGSED